MDRDHLRYSHDPSSSDSKSGSDGGNRGGPGGADGICGFRILDVQNLRDGGDGTDQEPDPIVVVKVEPEPTDGFPSQGETGPMDAGCLHRISSDVHVKEELSEDSLLVDEKSTTILKTFSCTKNVHTFTERSLQQNRKSHCAKSKDYKHNCSHDQVKVKSDTCEKIPNFTECNKLFSCSSASQVHTNTHNITSPNKCSRCNKASEQKSTHQVRLRTAAGMRVENSNDCTFSSEEGNPCLTIGQSSTPKIKVKKVSPVLQPTTPKFQTNRRRLNEQSWNLQEKEIIRHGKAYSAHEAWGTNGKGERLKTIWFTNNDPLPKMEVEIFSSGRTSSHLLKPTNGDNQRENTFKCSLCCKSFTRKATLQAHFGTHTGEKPFKCTVCSKSFNYDSNRKVHMRIHSGEKPFKCGVCNKLFRRISTYQNHMRTHTGVKPYQCILCNKSFLQRSTYHTHKRTHTGEKPYKCTVCSKTFGHISSRREHVKTHTGEKPYKCSMCSKSFITNSTCEVHMRKHTGEKPYKCTVCSRTFGHFSTHQAHIRTHTGEKPYTCSVCNKSFIKHSNCQAHMRTHTGEKPYKCSVCNKTFSQSSNLYNHRKIHSGEKRFKCSVCNKAFTHSSALNIHQQREKKKLQLSQQQ